ncbi:hypothetical protein EYC80_009168 [Monilinia laxa]|uniref:Uncharacterized protein n=1 Tax=Monilinia laxa TaxID=61186 RepID=A0A5N6K302_MONLA|nr:hypothetical protein EYC80_009168 [Monilinia laxa]
MEFVSLCKWRRNFWKVIEEEVRGTLGFWTFGTLLSGPTVFSYPDESEDEEKKEEKNAEDNAIKALKWYFGGFLGTGTVESEGLGEGVLLAVAVVDTVVPTVFFWSKNEVTIEPDIVNMDSLRDDFLKDAASDD